MLAEVALWHCKSSSLVASGDKRWIEAVVVYTVSSRSSTRHWIYPLFSCLTFLLWGILGRLIYNISIWYRWETEVKQLKLENTRAAGDEWGAAAGKVSPFFQRDPHCVAEETSWFCLWIWGFLELKTLKWSNSWTSAAGYSTIPEIMLGLLKKIQIFNILLKENHLMNLRECVSTSGWFQRWGQFCFLEENLVNLCLWDVALAWFFK